MSAKQNSSASISVQRPSEFTHWVSACHPAWQGSSQHIYPQWHHWKKKIRTSPFHIVHIWKSKDISVLSFYHFQGTKEFSPYFIIILRHLSSFLIPFAMTYQAFNSLLSGWARVLFIFKLLLLAEGPILKKAMGTGFFKILKTDFGKS